MNAALHCPVCLEPFGTVVWARREAGCAGCALRFALDGELAPARPVAGYPDRLLAARNPPGTPSPLRADVRGDQRWFRHGGWLSALAKTVVLAPDCVELHTARDTIDIVPLDALRGFIALQTIEWSGDTPSVMTTTALATATALRKLFFHDTWPAAVAAAATLNAALDSLRLDPGPYR